MHPTIRRLLTNKYLLCSLGVALFYTLSGFFLLPLASRWYLPRFARAHLHREASVETVRINPFRMTFEASGFKLSEADGAPLAGFGRLFLDFDPSAVFRRMARFAVLQLDSPSLHVVIEQNGETNLAMLIPGSPAPEPSSAPASDPMRLLLGDLAIAGGELTLTDKRQQEPETISFREIALQGNNLSTIRDAKGAFSLNLTTSHGETLSWRGEIGLVPFRSQGRLAFSDIRAATLWGFFRDAVRLEAPAGTLEISTEYSLDAGPAPFRLSLEQFKAGLSGASLQLVETGEPFLELNTLAVDAVRLDLAARTVQVGSVALDGGTLRFLVDEQGAGNVAAILRKAPVPDAGETAPDPREAAPDPSVSESPPGEPPEPAPWVVDLQSITVDNVRVEHEDRSRVLPLALGVSGISVKAKARMEAGAGNTAIRLERLDADIAKAWAGPKGTPKPLCAVDGFFAGGVVADFGAGTLSAERLGLHDGRVDIVRSEDGAVNLEQLFTVRGPPPRKADAETPPWTISLPAVEINNIALSYEDLGAVTPVSAGVVGISASSGVEIRTGGRVEASVKGFAAEAKGLRLAGKGAREPLFEAKRFFVQEGAFELGSRQVGAAVVGLHDGRLALDRDPDGKLNLAKLFTPKHPALAKGGEKKASDESGPAWSYSIKGAELAGFRAVLSDRRTNPKSPLYQFQDIRLQAADIDGRSPMAVQLSLAAGQGMEAKLRGKVIPSPLSVDATLQVKNLPLTPLQPYLDPYVTLTMQSGSVSTEGSLGYGVPRSGSQVVFDGMFSLDRLRLAAPGLKEPYLGWDALRIPDLKLSLGPNHLQIKELRLKKPLGELIIAEDRSINLARILKEPPSAAPAPQAPSRDALKEEASSAHSEKAETFPFDIGKVQVEGGLLRFADLSLTPKFMTRIHDLKGVVSRIASTGETLTDIHLDGGVDEYGYAKITGTMDLHDFKRSAAVNMSFQNVELVNVTPYAGKFAGRGIKNGKLSMDLAYTIEDSRMLGDNKIIVDNLELGEHVDSPDAVNLPLDLAVALLKDSSGTIDIGLPVSGDLNDPEFSLGPLLWKAFSHLITKVVSAPFRALGALFGGGEGEDLAALRFEAGQAELLPPAREKLKKVADALQNRSQLQLVIQGHYSPEADGLAFKKNSLRRAVGKLTEEKPAGNEDPDPLDLSEGKTRRALETIYAERFGAAALDEIDRGVMDGSITARPVESGGPEEGGGEEEKGFWKMVQNAKLYRLIPGVKSPEQAMALASELYARLVENETVPEEELRGLATARAGAVSHEMENTHGIPRDRLAAKDPEALADVEGHSVTLSLDARAVSP